MKKQWYFSNTLAFVGAELITDRKRTAIITHATPHDNHLVRIVSDNRYLRHNNYYIRTSLLVRHVVVRTKNNGL